MAETSFPVAGGSGVTDATYERLMGPITGSGRYAFNPTVSALNTPLIFADNSGRQVKAYANQAAILRGFRWESGSTPPVVALDANTSGNPRMDLIVLRLNRSDYSVRLGKTNGTPASVPAAPAPIQDTSSSGVWELPVASVKVASSGTTGQPYIQSTDVTALDWWLAPPSILLRNGNYIPNAQSGALAHRLDTGRTYRGVGGSYVPFGEIGEWTKITPSGGWTSDFIYCQRVNGFTYFQATVLLNVADKPGGTDLPMCTLPAEFRPQHDMYITGGMSYGQAAAGYISSTTGLVSIQSYAATFPKGGRAIFGPVTWPSTY